MTQFLSRKQLAKVLGVSERHIYRLEAAGRFPPPIKIGRCHRWDVDEVRRYFTAGNKGNTDQGGRRLQ